MEKDFQVQLIWLDFGLVGFKSQFSPQLGDKCSCLWFDIAAANGAGEFYFLGTILAETNVSTRQQYYLKMFESILDILEYSFRNLPLWDSLSKPRRVDPVTGCVVCFLHDAPCARIPADFLSLPPHVPVSCDDKPCAQLNQLAPWICCCRAQSWS